MRMAKAVLAASLSVLSLAGHAVPYHYVDWQSINPGAGTAAGTITLPDASVVNVGFNAVNPDGSAGSFSFGQTGCGNNYWNPTTPYVSAQVSNAPPNCELLALVGGQNQRYVVTLSEAIKDPIMAIVSLGQSGVTVRYEFDAPFDIVSQGAGYWGGSANALQEVAGDVLQGNEGHGTIQFIGTFSTFSWDVPTPENWHGFTFGIRTTERIEPTPPPANDVPVPGTLSLLALGMAALWTRRRNSA
jgi:hypothetical protein